MWPEVERRPPRTSAIVLRVPAPIPIPDGPRGRPRSRIAGSAIATCIAIAIPLATLALYARGALLTPPGKSFMWIHALNTGDPYAYLAWIEQAREGRASFRILFTEEPCRALLVHPLFFVIGLASKITGLPPIGVYHAARVALGVALLLILFRFFSRRLSTAGAALFALLYAALGSGLGWIFVRPDIPALRLPVDLWMPEAILFLTLLESPLFLAALVLALLILERLFGGTDRGGGAALFALTLLLGLIHPFEVVSIAGILAVAWILAAMGGFALPAKFARRAVAFGFGAAASTAYVRFVLRSDPVFEHWLDAVRSPSPPPACFALAFAPQILLALFALPRALARRSSADLLALAWPVATALLLYAPLAQQRRFIAGVQIPLTLLAAQGLFEGIPALAARLRGRRVGADGAAGAAGAVGAVGEAGARVARGQLARRALLAALLALFVAGSFATNAVVVGADLAYFERGEYPLYLERDVLDALAAFSSRAPEGALLLASPAVGHFVPALTGRRVVAGHADMTVDAERKAEDVRRFYDPRTPTADRRALIARASVTHVLVSRYEAELAGYDPRAFAERNPGSLLGDPAVLDLVPIHRSAAVTLYELGKARAPGP